MYTRGLWISVKEILLVLGELTSLRLEDASLGKWFCLESDSLALIYRRGPCGTFYRISSLSAASWLWTDPMHGHPSAHPTPTTQAVLWGYSSLTIYSCCWSHGDGDYAQGHTSQDWVIIFCCFFVFECSHDSANLLLNQTQWATMVELFITQVS